jgi:UTP-glucose-1-phosphate uridylyltransferase
MDGKRYDIGNKIDYIKTNITFSLENDETKSEVSEFIENIEKNF